MNKSEFIANVADKAQTSKAAAARVVDAIFDTASGAIAEAVNTAGKLSIPGFGKFSTKKRAARTGRNPRTGKEISIPERTSVSFTPGRALKETVSGGGAGGGTRPKAGGGGTGSKEGASTGTSATGGSRATGGTRAGGGTAAGTKAEGATRKSAAKKSGGTSARKTEGTAAKKSGGGSKGK